MLHIPDLVRDSKLDTEFDPEHTKHIYYEPGLTPRQRTVRREECWKRKRYIGRGSYGSVWLEHCVMGQREVEFRAVKMIRKLQPTSKPINYNRELEAIAKFSHWRYTRCFVKSFGWYESAEAVFITMEYLQHGDLHDYLTGAPPLPEVDAQQITSQILEGVSFMHDNGFAHRDLKPRNILLKSKPPEQWWVKIGDFGISKRAEEVSSTLKGTWGFLAPELLGLVKAGNESSPRNAQAADMWSLGEIAFRMLTGEPTFGTVGLLAVYVQMPENFPSNALFAHGVSIEGRDFLKRVMIPTQEKRPTAQDALRHDWMEPQRSPGLRPFSTVFESSPTSQETSTPNAADLISEPSARWSTIDIQSKPSSQRVHDGVRSDLTYSLSRTTVNNLNTTHQGIQNQRAQKPADAASANGVAENARAKLEKSYIFRSQGRWNEAEELVMQVVETSSKALGQEHPDELQQVEGLAAVHSRQDQHGVAEQPDGKLVASASWDKTVRLWDSATGAARRTLEGHSDAVWAVAFSPDGKLVASASRDKTARLWDSATREARRTLEGHSGAVYAVAFSPDGKLVASACWDKTVRLWDSTTGVVE